VAATISSSENGVEPYALVWAKIVAPSIFGALENPEVISIGRAA
jgi:hypothetical protein